jgi:hypothetical protein
VKNIGNVQIIIDEEEEEQSKYEIEQDQNISTTDMLVYKQD